MGAPVVDFHTEPFADADEAAGQLRGGYGSVFDPTAQRRPLLAHNAVTPTLILFGPSDHVLYPDYDRMAALVFDRHVGPFLLRDCGHFVPWEAPQALVSGVVAYCSDLLVADAPRRILVIPRRRPAARCTMLGTPHPVDSEREEV